MSIVAIIPARYASTRLPGKPLLAETGMPLIRHVVEAAGRSKRIARVIVATDDDRIAEAVRAFGGEVAMTREDHPSGTDRVAAQGGDQWWIRIKDVRSFVIEHVFHVDLRKVDKFWFVDLVANR